MDQCLCGVNMEEFPNLSYFAQTVESFAKGLAYMYTHTHLSIKSRSKISNAFCGFNARFTNDDRIFASL